MKAKFSMKELLRKANSNFELLIKAKRDFGIDGNC